MSKYVVVITDNLWWSTGHKVPELVRETDSHKYSEHVIVRLNDGTVCSGLYEYSKLYGEYRWYVSGGILSLDRVTHWRNFPCF